MGDKTLVVKRTIHAPVEKIWNAWTQVDEVKQWYAPEGMTTPAAEVDLTVGGKYSVNMHGQGPGLPPSGNVTARGVYKTIDPMKKLAFTWKWDGAPGGETLVTLDFNKLSDTETEVTLTHDLFESNEQVKEHTKGWESSFNKLGKYLG